MKVLEHNMISESARSKHLKPGAVRWERSLVQELLALVRRRYPQWKDFTDPAFLRDEINPKQHAARCAREMLSEGELQDLLDQGSLSRGAVSASCFDEFLRRCAAVGRESNLLWRKMPARGDLGILYHPSLDKPTFCLAVFDLLYGPGNSPARLERYLNYVRSHKLPNKWTFPTYFLFVCHPENDIFVNPATIKWFLSFVGQGKVWKPTPTADGYAAILEAAQRLKRSLKKQQPHDMVDIQSLLWTARAADIKATAQATAGEAKNKTVGQAFDHHLPAPPVTAPPVTSPTITPHNLQSDSLPPYSLAECAAATGLDEAVLAQWVEAIERKGQAILYGPPGTGKTFLAAHLAQHLASNDLTSTSSASHAFAPNGAASNGAASPVDGLWEVVQFHPAYAYEDFLQGLRPQPDATGNLAYTLVPGRFLDFCRRAQGKPGRCVLVIDEINRADLSQVLGELMFLLEYREQTISLAGGGRFHIPSNVRLLGTMNTANRSIALLDQALRRRFAFLPVAPNFQVLRRFHKRTGFAVEGLVEILERINRAVGDPHYFLGITFFLVLDLDRQIEGIWRFEIEPYLEDHFFDRMEEVEAFRWEKVRTAILR
jgi:DNA polymerase III delta prime subunit